MCFFCFFQLTTCFYLRCENAEAETVLKCVEHLELIFILGKEEMSYLTSVSDLETQ